MISYFKETIWDKVIVRGPDECWTFIGTKSKDGFGVVKFQGKTILAHRAAYMTANPTEYIEGRRVYHSCGVRDCVNPNHLYVSTRREVIDRTINLKIGRKAVIDAAREVGPLKQRTNDAVNRIAASLRNKVETGDIEEEEALIILEEVLEYVRTTSLYDLLYFINSPTTI